MSKARDQQRLQHMRDAALKAIDFASSKQRSDLDTDEMLALALVRLLEVVGEAASKVSEETRSAQPTLPWAKIVGMRHRLIHGYYVIDLDVLWQTIENDLNPLIDALNDILSNLDSPPEQ